MKTLSTSLAVLSLAMLPSCRTEDATGDAPAFDFEAASAIITARTERFTESHITGDLEYLDNVFTVDGRAYPPGSDRISGRADLSAINAQYVAYGVSEFSEVSAHRYGGPDYIVDEGTYTMTYGPDGISEAGHYINVWKQVGDDWKLAANMWTVLPAETE